VKTVALPAALIDAARVLAAAQRSTIRQVVTDALTAHLAAHSIPVLPAAPLPGQQTLFALQEDPAP